MADASSQNYLQQKTLVNQSKGQYERNHISEDIGRGLCGGIEHSARAREHNYDHNHESCHGHNDH